jgi:hypothetical protein
MSPVPLWDVEVGRVAAVGAEARGLRRDVLGEVEHALELGEAAQPELRRAASLRTASAGDGPW